LDEEKISKATKATQETAETNQLPIAISPMKSESKRILLTFQRKALNPITDKPMVRISDEVLEEALEIFCQHLKGKKVV
jgi:hypothetical protein